MERQSLYTESRNLMAESRDSHTARLWFPGNGMETTGCFRVNGINIVGGHLNFSYTPWEIAVPNLGGYL